MNNDQFIAMRVGGTMSCKWGMEKWDVMGGNELKKKKKKKKKKKSYKYDDVPLPPPLHFIFYLDGGMGSQSMICHFELDC